MPSYGATSRRNLDTCHPDLIRVFEEVIKRFDCSITEGHRTPERQAHLLALGRTKVKVSRHNSLPSEAVDAAPYPIDYTTVAEVLKGMDINDEAEAGDTASGRVRGPVVLLRLIVTGKP